MHRGEALLPCLQVPAFKLALPPRVILDFLPRTLRASTSLATPDVVTWHYYPGLSTRSALAKHRPLHTPYQFPVSPPFPFSIAQHSHFVA